MKKYKTIKTLKDDVLGKAKAVRSFRVEWNTFYYLPYVGQCTKERKSATFIDKDEAKEFYSALETCLEVLQQDAGIVKLELKEEV